MITAAPAPAAHLQPIPQSLPVAETYTPSGTPFPSWSGRDGDFNVGTVTLPGESPRVIQFPNRLLEDGTPLDNGLVMAGQDFAGAVGAAQARAGTETLPPRGDGFYQSTSQAVLQTSGGHFMLAPLFTTDAEGRRVELDIHDPEYAEAAFDITYGKVAAIVGKQHIVPGPSAPDGPL